jgi:hypothetical protein
MLAGLPRIEDVPAGPARRDPSGKADPLHNPARTHASFDDPNLVSYAGLVPVKALAQRAGLGELSAEHVRPGGECGVNAHLKVARTRWPQ